MITAPELRAGPALRVFRAGTLAIVAFSLGGVAHVAAGGLMPPVGWSVACVVALASVFAAVLGGPAARWAVVLLVSGGQFLVHGTLTALAGHAGDHPLALSPARVAPTVDPVPTATRLTDTDRRGSLFDLTTGSTSFSGSASHEVALPHWLGHVVADLSGPHALMMVAHLMAATGVALWLAAGEQSLWFLLVCLATPLALLGVAVLRRFVPIHDSGVSEVPRVRDGRPRRPSFLPAPLLGAVARRGPPLAGCS